MEEFKGKLESISPHKIINKDKLDKFDNFFLVLGLISNDLKDLILFLDLFHKTYRMPNDEKIKGLPSVHLGNWGGITNHLNRLILSLISEFIVFLRKNNELINSISFKNFENKLPKEVKKDWNDIVYILEDNSSEDFLSQIARIRSSITFHYDQSLKELRSGFIKKFFDSPKNEYNKKAFYSLGDTLNETRFFYCDGAVEEYLNEHMKVFNENNYYTDLEKLTKKTSKTIKYMMETYIDQKNKSR